MVHLLCKIRTVLCLNPFNLRNLKQLGRSLFLLGKHKGAIDVYQEAQRIGRGSKDWETWHQIGVCCTFLKQYGKALESFKEANKLQRHDITYIEIGKVHMMQEKWNDAVEVGAIAICEIAHDSVEGRSVALYPLPQR